MLGRFACPLALVCMLTILLTARAGEKNPHELELTTERAIIFKDGYALIIKRGVATTDQEGEVFTDDVPDAAVIGTFWALPDKGRLVSMLAGWKSTKESEEKQVACSQPIEVLLANKGKQARVEVHDKTFYSGVVQQVLVDKTEMPVPASQLESIDALSSSAVSTVKAAAKSHVSSAVPFPPTADHSLTAISGSYFVLRTDEGDLLLPVSDVRSVVVKDMKTTIGKTLTTAKKTKRLSFRFEEADRKQALTIMYFRPGFRWIPSYRVSLTERAEKPVAAMMLQAELIDEAEDFQQVPLDIVVGVPNFRFRGTPSPLVLEATLRNALAQAAPDLSNTSNAFSNAMYSQRAGEVRRLQAQGNPAEQSDVNLPGELTAGGAQDLFVYHLPKITIGKSDRVAVPIFSADLPYRDLYTWDVHLTKQDTQAAPTGSGAKSPLALSQNEVWHQVVLTNTTNLPWTTGAAMIMQGNQPLAQELLTYAPPKDEVRLPVTVSVDTRGNLTEKEVGRDLNKLQWDGHNYAQIDKEIQLHLCNNKAIEIDVEVSLRVGGKVDKASDDGDVTLGAFDPADWIQYQSHPAVNNSSAVRWKTHLEPGEVFEPTLTYHYFSRH